MDHDALVSDWRLKHPDPAWLPQVEALVGGFAGRRVLDCGCGSGQYAKEIIRAGAAVVGIDQDASAILLAKGARLATGMYAQARVEAIPLAARAVDIALMRYVIHQIPAAYWNEVFGEIRRVLAQTGLLVLELCYREQALTHFDHVIFLPLRRIIETCYPEREQLLTSLAKQNFTVRHENEIVRKKGQVVPMDMALSNSQRLVEYGRGPSTWRRLTQSERKEFHERRAAELPRMFPGGLVPRDWSGTLIVAEGNV